LQPDLYELLGVERAANPEELKRAYRKQALRFHPDRNPGDLEAERRFKEVTWAYQVLSDAVRRAQYDRFGRVFTDGRSQGPFGTAEDIHLSDIFGSVLKDIFGSRKRNKRSGASVQDLRYTVTIRLEEAARGVEKEVRFTRKTPDGTVHNEHLKVKVPAGIDTGQKLKVRGKGSGKGDQSGDLYVVVNVADHEYFRRRGQDVFCDVPVTYAQALLGAEITVPTVFGNSVIRLPQGTQPGAVLTLKGKGLPSLSGRGKRRGGDQYAKVVLDMPTSLDERVKESLLALDRELAEHRSDIRKTYERFLAPEADPSEEKAS